MQEKLEIDKLKGTMYKYSYPRDLLDKCIKYILDKILAPKTILITVSGFGNNPTKFSPIFKYAQELIT